MKYTGHTLSFQEVPGETSLAISISNCPFRCQGCHSSYLQTDVGDELTPDKLLSMLNKYRSPHTDKYTITCVVFFGGEQHRTDFLNLTDLIHSLGLRICLYTGAELSDIDYEILSKCDYIKVGQFDLTLGGLNKPTTNQRLYVLPTLTDITHKFWED